MFPGQMQIRAIQAVLVRRARYVPLARKTAPSDLSCDPHPMCVSTPGGCGVGREGWGLVAAVRIRNRVVKDRWRRSLEGRVMAASNGLVHPAQSGSTAAR